MSRTIRVFNSIIYNASGVEALRLITENGAEGGI
jgi:hypothetical protein